MGKTESFYFIMPAYNEQDNIEHTVKSWYKIVEKVNKRIGVGGKSKLVVINDGSKDNTLKVLTGLKKSFSNLIVLDKKNSGHGPTLIYGYNYAIKHKADWIFQTDSDGQTNPEEFEAFFKDRDKYDAIFGRRRVRGDGKSRKFVETTLCQILRHEFGIKVPDANAPFRLMRASLVEKYLKYFPEDYNLPNVMLVALSKYYKENITFKEISFSNRKAGKNSINIPKITKIGLKAIKDFKNIRNKLDSKSPYAPKYESHNTLKNFVVVISLAIMAFIFSMHEPQNPFSLNARPTGDSAVFQTVALHMQNGEIPYRDVFDHKGPLLYLINLIGISISYEHGIWLMIFIAILISLLYSYKTCRLKARKIPSVLIVVLAYTPLFAFFSEHNCTETFALPFISYGIYIFFRYMIGSVKDVNGKFVKDYQIALFGLSAGATLMLRPNLVAAWVPMVAIIIGRLIYNKQYVRLVREALLCLVGVLLSVIPFIIWLAINNALDSFIDCYISFNLTYSKLSPDSNSIINKIIAIANSIKSQICAFVTIIAILLAIKKRDLLSISSLAIIILSIVLCTGISGAMFEHYYIPLAPTYVFSIAYLYSLLMSSKNPEIRQAYQIIGLFALFIMLGNIWSQQFYSVINSIKNTGQDQNFGEYGKVIDYVKKNTAETDRIIVNNNIDNIIYYGAKRKSAIYYIFSNPIDYDESRRERYLEDLQKSNAKLIIMPKKLDQDIQEILLETGYAQTPDFIDSTYDIYKK